MNNQKDQQMKQAVYFIDDEPTDMRSTEVSSNSMQTVIPNSIPRTTVQKQSDSQHSNCTTTVPANKYVPGRDAANLAIAWISSTESLKVGITGTRITSLV